VVAVAVVWLEKAKGSMALSVFLGRVCVAGRVSVSTSTSVAGRAAVSTSTSGSSGCGSLVGE
jgi:hypothetical protein